MYSGMYLGINPAIHDFGLGSRVWGINSCGLKLRIYCTVQDLFGKVKTFSKKKTKAPWAHDFRADDEVEAPLGKC